MPQPKNDAINALPPITEYQKLFQMLSDIDMLNALIFLQSRESNKPFTPNLLVKELSIPVEKAEFILEELSEYGFLWKQEIELDDEIKKVDTFLRAEAFIPMLIFAKEIITRPTNWNFHSN
jgi:DNA replication protein DnaD